MQGVHDVVVAGNRIRRRFVHALGPVWSTYNNDGIVIVLADNGNNVIRIFLYIAPACAAAGLVADFIENIVLVGIGFCHFFKEFLGFILIDQRAVLIQHMPVDNHIHIVVGCILDTALHDIFQIFLIAIGTVTAVFMGIHGKTHDIYIPLVTELAECILVHVCGEPADAVGTDALKLHRIAVFVHKLGTVHGKSTAYGRYRQVIVHCLCLRILIVFRVCQAFVPAIVLRFAFVVACVIFRR